MRYYSVPLDEVLNEMRAMLKQYSTREIERFAYVDHVTVSRFLNGRNINSDNMIALHEFLKKEERKSNLQIKG